MSILITVFFFLSVCSSHPYNPPRLDDDTHVNILLSQKAENGGLRQLDPNTELVAEHPPGSGSVIVLQTGYTEFVPKSTEENREVINAINRELIEEVTNIQKDVNNEFHDGNTFEPKPLVQKKEYRSPRSIN
eukprot:GFUD01054567.1.p1 GENE.GFUD01054567.1~~GFUD01054567.1.p1  ORF type:complete len:132 (+),score=34.04 GFUD01054567.1:35-430(+)